MSSDFRKGDTIAPVKAYPNRDGANYFLTRANDAWMRLARYCELYERGELRQLLAEIDANTQDGAIHPNAVLLMAVRLASAVSAVHGGRPASRISLAFAQTPNNALEVREQDGGRLWIPRD